MTPRRARADRRGHVGDPLRPLLADSYARGWRPGPARFRPGPARLWRLPLAGLLAQCTYSEGAVFVRVQVAERPVPSDLTLPSFLSWSRTSLMVWSLIPGTAVLMSARRNVTGAWRRMCSRMRCCLVPGVLAEAARSANTL